MPATRYVDKANYANKGLYLSMSAKMINDQIDNNFDDSAELFQIRN
jgi:hypothetical protein